MATAWEFDVYVSKGKWNLIESRFNIADWNDFDFYLNTKKKVHLLEEIDQTEPNRTFSKHGEESRGTDIRYSYKSIYSNPKLSIYTKCRQLCRYIVDIWRYRFKRDTCRNFENFSYLPKIQVLKYFYELFPKSHQTNGNFHNLLKSKQWIDLFFIIFFCLNVERALYKGR